jgi:uncharacterized protein with von Willebrand factor type A (vWA) domain
MDVYWAARATIVTRPEHIPIFDAEFGRFWRRLLDQADERTDAYLMTGETDTADLPNAPRPNKKQEQPSASGEPEKERTILAIEGTDEGEEGGEAEDIEAPPEDVLIFSAREALRKKDFSQFTSEEIAEARRIFEQMSRPGRRAASCGRTWAT